MKKSLVKLSCVALVGACCAVKPAAAYVIPIASMVEWPQEIMLLFESEVKRWEHEAIKYKELLYTDMMGKSGVNGQGQGSLGQNQIVDDLKLDAEHGASAIQKTQVTLKCAGGNVLVDDLANYDNAKSQIEGSYVIQPDKFKKYSEQEFAKIQENQRVAVSDLAKSALATSGIEIVVDTGNKGGSEPSKSAENIAAATDMNAMFELMTAMDQRVYEKSLRMSNMEATNMELKAMQSIQGLSRVNPNKEEEDNK